MTRLLLALALLGAVASGAAAQAPAPAPRVESEVLLPHLWDPRRRVERPPLPANLQIRFLIEPDNPPFTYLGRDGQPTGFSVELARAVCIELAVACTIQARAWETIIPTLRENRADVVLAALQPTESLRASLDVTDAYLRTGGRFAARRDGTAFDPLRPPAGVRIGVAARSAHAAFLDAAFPTLRTQRFDSAGEAREALAAGGIDVVFGDAVQLAVWLNAEAGRCCVFSGGAYLEPAFFGEGHVMVIRRGETTLRRAIDHALQRIAERGVYTELYLRWFPLGLY